MPDDFEKSFADISYNFLEQKAPRLMPYLVGFKLIDRNDTQTRGIGVYMFSVGPATIMAPAFWINGQVKPMEMLYLKDKDRFVPFDDDWVDHLIKQMPFELGQVASPKEDQINTQIDLRNFILPPRTGRFVTADWNGKLPDFLSEASSETKEIFAGWLKKSATLLETVDTLYTWPRIKEALAKPNARELAHAGLRKIASDKAAQKTVKYYTNNSSPEQLRTLDTEALTKLAADSVYVKDPRPKVSKMYSTQYFENWHNPSQPGIYRIINNRGEVVMAFVHPTPVLFHDDTQEGMLTTGAPGVHDRGYHDRSNNMGVATSIKDKSTLTYTTHFSRDGDYNVSNPTDQVWARQVSGEDLTKEFADKFYDKAVDSDKGSIGKAYIFITKKSNNNLNVTQPFEIQAKADMGDGLIRYKVRTPNWNTNSNGPCCGYSTDSFELVVSGKQANQKIQYMGKGRFMVPAKSWKLMEVKAPESYKVSGGYALDYNKEEKRRAKASLGTKNDLSGLGSPTDVFLTLRSGNNYDLVKVSSEIGRFRVSVNGSKVLPILKLAAVKTLVENLGIRGEEAIEIIKTAESRPVEFLVKVATPLSVPQVQFDPQMTGAQQVPGGPTYQEHYYNPRLVTAGTPYGPPPQMGRGENIYTPPPPMDLINAAQQAAQMGAPDVMDAGMIAALAAESDVGASINPYMTDLELALDRIYRILFMLWWKTDLFKDKYGVSELKEMESRIRNIGRELGKFVLEFKTKETAAATQPR
jgi:hypothetical protein